jgi:spermidine/putrescine-binding protein
MNGDLAILAWPDNISPETLEGFRQRFGVAVRLEVAPSSEAMIARLHQPGPAPDVLCPYDWAVRDLAAEGRLHYLDHTRLPNLAHLQPRFRYGRLHDSDCSVSVVKDWGTTGFMYRTDLVRDLPRSWADFWRLAEKYSGRVVAPDSPGEVIGAALKMRGHSHNASGEEALAEARAALLNLKPHLLGFESNYRPLLASGRACLALGWNGDAAALNAAGVRVQYVAPSEGSQIWEVDWAIPFGAPNLDAAYTFVNYVMRPEVGAQEAQYTRYATGNQGALALLDISVRLDPTTYPPRSVLERLEPALPLDEDGSRRREEIWWELRGMM